MALCVVEFCLSDDYDELERYVVQVVGGLRSQAHLSVHTITCTGTFLADRLAGSNNKSVTRPLLRALVAAVRAWARHVESISADIIHINRAQDLVPAMLIKLFCSRALKLVFTRHSPAAPRTGNYFRNLAYRYVDLLLVPAHQTPLIAPNDSPARPPYALLPPPGAAPAGVERRLCSDLDLDDGVFTIGMFSEIDRRHRQHILLEAMFTLNDRDVDFQGAFVGRPTKQNYFSVLVAKAHSVEPARKIVFRSLVDNPIVFMPCFDVIVLPAGEQNLGLVLAEALHMGITVIGAKTSAAAGIIEHGVTGMLAEPDDAQDLANILTRLYRNKPLRQRLAAQGKLFAANHLTAEGHYSRLAQMFARVAKSPAVEKKG